MPPCQLTPRAQGSCSDGWDAEPVCLRSGGGDGTQTSRRALFPSVRPLPARGPAVTGGEATAAGRCRFSHRRHLSNWKIQASLLGFSQAWPRGGRDPGVPSDSSHLLQGSGVLPDPLTRPQPQHVPHPSPRRASPIAPGPTELLSSW